jgi:hypothetical protein
MLSATVRSSGQSDREIPQLTGAYRDRNRLQLDYIGRQLMLYPNLPPIWQTESKSNIVEIMDSLSCFLHNVNFTLRIEDAT